MNLDLSVIAQITSILGFLGVLVAAASLFVGLRRHRQGRQTDYVTTLRKAIFTSRSSLEKIAETVWLRPDFVYEMTSGVADSKPLKVAIEEMYLRFFERSVRLGEGTADTHAREEELDKYLDPANGEFPTIMVPIRGSLLEQCDDLITRIGGEIEPYRFDYPALTRVFLSVNRYLSNIIGTYKGYVRDDTVWRSAVPAVDADYGNTIDSPDELNGRLTEQIVTQWYQESIRDGRDGEVVGKLLDIVDLVSSAYLAKTERELLEAGKRETAENFAPMEQVPKITDNLNEAYKGLKWILADLDQKTYHDLVREIAEQPR